MKGIVWRGIRCLDKAVPQKLDLRLAAVSRSAHNTCMYVSIGICYCIAASLLVSPASLMSDTCVHGTYVTQQMRRVTPKSTPPAGVRQLFPRNSQHTVNIIEHSQSCCTLKYFGN